MILTSLIGRESATAEAREHEVSRNPSDVALTLVANGCMSAPLQQL